MKSNFDILEKRYLPLSMTWTKVQILGTNDFYGRNSGRDEDSDNDHADQLRSMSLKCSTPFYQFCAWKNNNNNIYATYLKRNEA